jgi:hypothetical protein
MEYKRGAECDIQWEVGRAIWQLVGSGKYSGTSGRRGVSWYIELATAGIER